MLSRKVNRAIKVPAAQFSFAHTGRRCKVEELPGAALFLMNGYLWQRVPDDDICLLELDDNTYEASWASIKDAEIEKVEREEPWIPYQPFRKREKAFYDIKLRDGTVIECCWPDAKYWNPAAGSVPRKAGKPPFADHRVIQIRRCKSPDEREKNNYDNPENPQGHKVEECVTGIESGVAVGQLR